MAGKAWAYLTAKNGEKIKVDQEDLPTLNQYSWRVTTGTTGRRRVVTSMRTEKGARSITLGKFLMKPETGKQVYPRRFNEELDYRKDNLIVCTLAERQQLLPKKRTATSSTFRGVSFSRSTSKWRAGIEVDGKSINLGSYDTEEEAARAYNEAAKKYFGDKAYQNPINRPKLPRD
jgi:AP2-like factor (euAP2 lineage)